MKSLALQSLRCVRQRGSSCSSAHGRPVVHGAPVTRTLSASSTLDATKPGPALSKRQLRLAFVNAAIPMAGFGFMDNVIMIQAGDAIDAHVGYALGLSTLTSCALGQLLSDSSGVFFGQTIDRIVAKLGLPHHGCTNGQTRTALFRNVTMAGSVAGVIVGCLLGTCFHPTHLLFSLLSSLVNSHFPTHF